MSDVTTRSPGLGPAFPQHSQLNMDCRTVINKHTNIIIVLVASIGVNVLIGHLLRTPLGEEEEGAFIRAIYGLGWYIIS